MDNVRLCPMFIHGKIRIVFALLEVLLVFVFDGFFLEAPKGPKGPLPDNRKLETGLKLI